MSPRYFPDSLFLLLPDTSVMQDEVLGLGCGFLDQSNEFKEIYLPFSFEDFTESFPYGFMHLK